VIIADLEDAAAAEAPQSLCRWMMETELRVIDRLSHEPADISRKRPQVVEG